MQLKQITGRYLELNNLASDPESGLTDDQIKDTLDGIEGEFNDKAISVVSIINEISLDASKVEAEIDRLKKRKKIIENRESSIREYLKSNMVSSGITNIKCPLFSITLAKGRDIVSVFDEGAIDDEYMSVKISMSPDKVKMLKALKEDPDSVSGAKLVTSEPLLRIK